MCSATSAFTSSTTRRPVSGLDIRELQCRLQTFDKAPGNRVGDYVLDANDSCVISTVFDNGALGSITMSRYSSGHQNDLELAVHGTRGAVRIATNRHGDRVSSCLGADMNLQRWRELPGSHPSPIRSIALSRQCALVSLAARTSPTRRACRCLLERCVDSDARRAWLTVDEPAR